MSIRNAATVDNGMRDNLLDVNEGQRLRELLDKMRFAQQDLADVCGVTRAAVSRWCKIEKFPDKVWSKIADGLRSLNLNPGEIRAEHATASGAQEDFIPLVEHWKRPQLATLRRILEGDFSSRDRLLTFLKGALMKVKE